MDNSGFNILCPGCEGDTEAFCRCIADAFAQVLEAFEKQGSQTLIKVCNPDTDAPFFVDAFFDCDADAWQYTITGTTTPVVPGTDFVPCVETGTQINVPQIEAGALITVQDPNDPAVKFFVNAILDEETGAWTYFNAADNSPVVPMTDFVPCQDEPCTLLNSVGTITDWSAINP